MYKMAKNIKICYVVSVEMTIRFILFNTLKFLKNQGYDVYVVCSSGKWLKNIEKQGIKIKTIRFKRKISPISDLITLFRLYFYFKKEKFDIIHTHTPKPGLIGQLAAKMAGIPIIVNTIHGLYFQEKDSWLKRKFFILTEKIAAKCSNLIFFVNREDIETAVKEKICESDLAKYFGGSIDSFKFNPERFSRQWIYQKKRELNLDPSFKIIGIVGRLVKEKGYLDLFQALRKVLERFPKTLLLIVGFLESEKKDALDPNVIVKNYGIGKNVIFLGEQTKVVELYVLMDIFVLPSHREGLGLAILEASAMEKPVIVTDIRGCREAVDDGKTGILVPLRNPEKLAEAIIYLLNNPEKTKEMGIRGREKVLREFDERIIFSRIKIEYQRLIKEKLK
ncbi:MAG: glycosyltransferase family 1 protein [Candidatus Nealsonbacteria bacterium CG10_big_fil_rev_8_21_14_0_10_36_24]|uniref:Glycosyltransferase family 1 protein n=2 Tax=Candidatus Nealsoniibacteriota TaxID=1817911 RepID=A0A2H0YNN0_9BACT|nr:MAG: glycosyltransferase family 1 protein [Candidatus Nealsonbacteria bacterium CG10_big_fil_rev_8_21_14_0_10_36_24]PIS40070.1 MAG: glycosyltransferase family 1 protein [Candidatus Nealsonbacteria bacterium CG08_land_8_20_14_0_20_36_22]